MLALAVLGLLLFPLGHMMYDRYHVPEAPVGSDEWRVRADTLARARVFLRETPGAEMPPAAGPDLECRYEPKDTTGTTPKFDCRLPDGQVVKVKYGVNPEIPGEVAARRLLAAHDVDDLVNDLVALSGRQRSNRLNGRDILRHLRDAGGIGHLSG